MIEHKGKIILISLLLLLTAVLIPFSTNQNAINDHIIAYVIDPKSQDLQMFWKNDSGGIINSIQNLKSYVESKDLTLLFAMNGGMYKKDYSPQGLFIQKNTTLTKIDTSEGKGNFYLKPNGIFYVTNNYIPMVCKTNDFVDNGNINFATQSGPMLVIDGQIHTAFTSTSKNLNIRNGVGILPNNKIVFAMSKTEINFYNFAKYFQKIGCKNALYLDGYVSRMYLPEKKWTQTDGNFGVIIGVTEKQEK